MFKKNQEVTVSIFGTIGKTSQTCGIAAARIVSKVSDETYRVNIGNGMRTTEMNVDRILPYSFSEAETMIAYSRDLRRTIRQENDLAMTKGLMNHLLQMKKKYPFCTTPTQLDKLKKRFSHQDELMKILRQM